MVLEIGKEKKVYILHKVSLADIGFAMKSLIVMLKSGLGFEASIEGLSRQVTDPKLAETFSKIKIDVGNGLNLSASMKKYPKIFPPIVTSVVQIGEQGATLEKNLEYLGEYLDKKYKIQKDIRGAMVYPLIVLGMTGIEFIVVIFFIIPQIEKVFEAFDDPPTMTRVVLGVSSFIRENARFIFPAIIIFIVLFRRYLGTKRGSHAKDRVMIRFPVLKSLVRYESLSHIARTLSLLLDSGIPLQEALEITASTTANSVYREKMLIVTEQVREGVALSTALESMEEYFPYTFIKLIEVGEQTSSLKQNLDYAYEFYERELDSIISNLTNLLQPLLMIFIAFVLGGLAISIIAPVYQLTGSIGNN